MSSNGAEVVNWWAYSVELCLAIGERDCKELPQVIDSGEWNLGVVTEGSLSCFRRHRAGQVREHCDSRVVNGEEVIEMTQ